MPSADQFVDKSLVSHEPLTDPVPPLAPVHCTEGAGIIHRSAAARWPIEPGSPSERCRRRNSSGSERPRCSRSDRIGPIAAPAGRETDGVRAAGLERTKHVDHRVGIAIGNSKADCRRRIVLQSESAADR